MTQLQLPQALEIYFSSSLETLQRISAEVWMYHVYATLSHLPSILTGESWMSHLAAVVAATPWICVSFGHFCFYPCCSGRHSHAGYKDLPCQIALICLTTGTAGQVYPLFLPCSREWQPLDRRNLLWPQCLQHYVWRGLSLILNQDL